jgi:hypothetical protein
MNCAAVFNSAMTAENWPEIEMLAMTPCAPQSPKQNRNIANIGIPQSVTWKFKELDDGFRGKNRGF